MIQLSGIHILRDEIAALLTENNSEDVDDFEAPIAKKPYVIMVVEMCIRDRVWIAAAYTNEIVAMKQEGDEGRKGNVEKAIQNALLWLCERLK